MIEQYLEYLQDICKDNILCLKKISIYKVESAGENINLEKELYSYISNYYDIISYNVFSKKDKISKLILV